MCEQCNTEAAFFGEPIPGWYLMRATKDGIKWKSGEWGLVFRNDPDLYWTSTPTPSALFNIQDEDEQEAWLQANKGTPEYVRVWMEVPHDFATAFMMEPGLGYDLVTAAMKRGYDPETSGDFTTWFFDLLGEHLKDMPMQGIPRESTVLRIIGLET